MKGFLLNTGFPFEMAMDRKLRNLGYQVRMNYPFLDLDENKTREIDLLASKEINGVKVEFIIECKQSYRDTWIFIAPEERPKRFYTDVRHYPRIIDLKNQDKCFDHTHFYNRKYTLATRYIPYDGKKQSDSSPFNDAVSKVVKSTIYRISENKGDKRIIFYPLILFSGKMFLAQYSKKLTLRKSVTIQYRHFFESKAYQEGESAGGTDFASYDSTGRQLLDRTSREKQKRNKIREINDSLTSQHLVDIVNKSSLIQYIKAVEDEIMVIPQEYWISEVTIKNTT